jgi:small subunit ribosomal protein S18
LPGGGRHKPCQFCKDKVDIVDYRDLASLRRAISDKGARRAR